MAGAGGERSVGVGGGRSVGADVGLPADVSVFVEAGQVVVLLSGHVDLALAVDLEDAGRDAIDADLPLLVDVSAVNSIDSMGLAFLLRLAGSPGARAPVCLRGPSPQVAELLRLVAAQHLFAWADEASRRGLPSPAGSSSPFLGDESPPL